MEWWAYWNEVENSLFMVKLSRSRTAARKQTGLGEMRPQRTVGTTTGHPWWPPFRHSSIFFSFHAHSDLGVSVGVKVHSFRRQIWVKCSENLRSTENNHIQVQNRKRSVQYSIKHLILTKNGIKWPQNGMHFKDVSRGQCQAFAIVLEWVSISISMINHNIITQPWSTK